MSRAGGWLADHLDRRRLVLAGLLLSIAFCCTYPFLHSLVALIVLGSVEAGGFATVLPAVQSMLTQSVPEGEHGRVQGLFGTAETGAITVSAGAGGALFGITPVAPFLSAAILALGMTLTLPFVWRGVPGRVVDAHAGEMEVLPIEPR
jgi:MFS family permease